MRMVKQSPHHRSKSCAAALCLLVSVPVPIVHCQLPGAVFFFFFNTQVCFAFSCFLRGELIANNNRAAQGGDSIGSNSSKLSGLHHVFFASAFRVYDDQTWLYILASVRILMWHDIFWIFLPLLLPPCFWWYITVFKGFMKTKYNLV